jgi:hypothetical protein
MAEIMGARCGQVMSVMPQRFTGTASLEDIDWNSKRDDVSYLEDVCEMLEMRKAFALMAITPEKIVRMNATQAIKFAADTERYIIETKKKIKEIRRQNKACSVPLLTEGSGSLSEDERIRIDNSIGRK